MNRPSFIPFDPDQMGEVTPPRRTPGAAPAAPAKAEGPGTAKPLSNREKWQLSALAEATYEHLKAAGQIPAGECLEHFRHRIAEAACGRRISQASHGDRMLIQAAFLALKGNIRQAARAQVKAAGTAVEIARHKLREAANRHGLSTAYVEGIARRIYKRGVVELTAKEVWSILYTVNNAANAAAGKGRRENRYKALRAKRDASKQTPSL